MRCFHGATTLSETEESGLDGVYTERGFRMKIEEVAEVLQAQIHSGQRRQRGMEVSTVASCDLMSDVLARTDSPSLLLTGLATQQAIRTCSISGIPALVVVRGKVVEDRIVDLAEEVGVVLMSTRLTLFDASGQLYQKGLRGGRP
jgi:hypothetical protein